MNEIKHTPGPWIWAPDYKGLYGAGPNNAVLDHEFCEGMWLAWLDKAECASLAAHLREVADELVPDDVSYGDLEAAWKRDQALEAAGDSKLPALPEGCNPKLHDVGPFFDEDQMREYACAAIAAAREA